MERSLDAARAAGHTLVILVGDEPYYARVGFKRVPPGRLTMPGPVDPDRLLYCELVAGAFDGVSGTIGREMDAGLRTFGERSLQLPLVGLRRAHMFTSLARMPAPPRPTVRWGEVR